MPTGLFIANAFNTSALVSNEIEAPMLHLRTKSDGNAPNFFQGMKKCEEETSKNNLC